MKHLLTLLLLSLPAFCGWGVIEGSEYRFVISRVPVTLTVPGLNLPTVEGAPRGALVICVPREGTGTDERERRITLRWSRAGKTYRQTLTAQPMQNGAFGNVFYADMDDVLSVDIERVNPPVIEEAQ